MVPVLTIITLIEAVTVLISITGKTIIAVDKLKNGKPEDVDIEALKKALVDLPDLTSLFPSTTEEDKDTLEKDRNPVTFKLGIPKE